ncbi:hypothetical protein R3P38DRAFT_2803943 [Favolaschia claudopus]|uniref:Uncharacterized protein n=1 Tax=Favolaschia claudopus TaxID=2862362 RepID=A0AAV9ZR46_9AGAR
MHQGAAERAGLIGALPHQDGLGEFLGRENDGHEFEVAAVSPNGQSFAAKGGESVEMLGEIANVGTHELGVKKRPHLGARARSAETVSFGVHNVLEDDGSGHLVTHIGVGKGSMRRVVRMRGALNGTGNVAVDSTSTKKADDGFFPVGVIPVSVTQTF